MLPIQNNNGNVNKNSFGPLFVVVGSYLNEEKLTPMLGGTETYTSTLIELAREHDQYVTILQKSARKLDIKLEDKTRVISWDTIKNLRETLQKIRIAAKGILLMYQPFFLPEQQEHPVVLVQHGIGHDGTFDPARRALPLIWAADIRRRVRVMLAQKNALDCAKRFTRIICVDTNYINWTRASNPMYEFGNQLTYIPNFADASFKDVVLKKWQKHNDPIIVLFARRFVVQRGVYLWLECVEKLAMEFPEVEFRFVGHGQAEDLVKIIALSRENVKVYARTHEKMRAEYESAHISIIPSLWSEGTSLSCIESMGAGCAVITSNVGGLCNLVVPDHNGLLIEPTSSAFYNTTLQLLHHREHAMTLGMRGYEIFLTSFTKTIWKQRFLKLFMAVRREDTPPVLKRRIFPV